MCRSILGFSFGFGFRVYGLQSRLFRVYLSVSSIGFRVCISDSTIGFRVCISDTSRVLGLKENQNL